MKYIIYTDKRTLSKEIYGHNLFTHIYDGGLSKCKLSVSCVFISNLEEMYFRKWCNK